MAQLATNWIRQTDWYLDADNGDDDNDGLTPGTALATAAELRRRWGERPLIAEVVTVNVLSDLDEDVILRADVATGGRLDVIGTPIATLVSGATIATGQGWSYATGANGQDAQVTSGDIPDFSDYAVGFGSANPNSQIRRQSDGAFGFILDTTGTVATGQPTMMARESSPGSWNYSDLNAADVIDVVQLPQIRNLLLDVQKIGNVEFSDPPFMVLQDVAVERTCFVSGSNYFSGLPLEAAGCIFRDVVQGPGSIFLRHCWFQTLRNLVGSAIDHGGHGSAFGCSFFACTLEMQSFVNVGAGIVLDNRCYVTANGDCASFDSPGYGVRLTEGSVLRGGNWFGSNGSYGFDVDGAAVYYSTSGPPKLTGSVNDTFIGGTATAYGALPFINPANNAMMVAELP
jgi:hypothetical protein